MKSLQGIGHGSLRIRLLCVGMLVFCGCTKGTSYNTVPATGTVLYQGRPLPGAQVAFLGDGKTPPALAVTAQDGTFSLTTSVDGDGAVPGTYQVTVSKMSGSKAAASNVKMSMDEAAAASSKGLTQETQEPTSLIPAHYAAAATSGLSYEVKSSGENDFKIELTD